MFVRISSFIFNILEMVIFTQIKVSMTTFKFYLSDKEIVQILFIGEIKIEEKTN